MNPYRVHLTSPKTYCTFLGDCGNISNEPICGSVAVTIPTSHVDSSEYAAITVQLTRHVVLRRCRSAKTRRRDSGLFQILHKRRSIQEQPSPTWETISGDNAETLMQCHLWQTPDHVQHPRHPDEAVLKFNFAVPVDHLTLATTETPMGVISYTITATARFPCGMTMTTTKPIEMLRRMIPGFRPTFHHFRYFPGEQVTMGLDVTPEEPVAAGTEASFTARLAAYKTITPGPRATEMRHVVIEELRWWVQETVGVLTVSGMCGAQDVIREKEQSVRRLCEGRQSGRWSATGGQRKTETTSDIIKVDFDIVIPVTANMAEELDMAAYNIDAKQSPRHQPSCEHCSRAAMNVEKPAIIVNHQLGIEIIASEDTIDQVTGSLVDRKPWRKAFRALIQLPIHGFASPQEVPAAIFQGSEMPPLYDNTLQPPEYGFI
ncbi:uncharacterized protein ACLA_077980 [Aspergillus clavatus NRRL 1]|uniref:Arrestin-like N-terminal domain-containing protein n=1 Tax=Aspergillus clavatus (strain ATCC 1007 / CBS 513.65 / DSM 816 / NCTC 3887 / NRRL 1 / QM 1276 / 107) TaxID=344612 RepID=A1CLS1_ASPCL|nr:uncharacterized protein ACLA_077980 [Aspergillus clavatus NRRL 1]EAW09050.1 conserved hypothetical protein [Aspergillus clavatus NRRL 1]